MGVTLLPIIVMLEALLANLGSQSVLSALHWPELKHLLCLSQSSIMAKLMRSLGFPGGSVVKNPPAKQETPAKKETQVRFLG